jgi:hypothetical protein
VLENRALRGIIGSKRVEVKEKWRKLHSEIIDNLYYSPNVTRMIKSVRIRWTCKTNVRH